MKRKFVVKALAMLLSASVILSSMSSGMGILAAAVTASAANNASSDVSDTSVVVNSAVAVEGDKLSKLTATGITGGTGTQESPYLINDVNELLSIGNYVNDTTNGNKYFRLENDIDLSAVTFSDFSNYEDIYALISATPSLSGNADIYFNFDGNGKKLYNLNLVVPEGISAVGIFGFVNANSVIRNLTFENIAIYNQNPSNVATAIGAVQNNGTISVCSFINPKIDLSSASSDYNSESATLSGGKVYTGYAVIASDNNGTISDCNITATDSERGIILVKGDRRFIGGIAGQNRNTITDCTVSGLRIYSYGSDDTSSWTGKGAIASYIGAVAGRNNAKSDKNDSDSLISGCFVELSKTLDIAFGDYVGGVVGYNNGIITNSEVNGGTESYGSAPTVSSTDLYGSGRFGGIAGGNNGTISSSGAYNVGFTFSADSDSNAYGGIVGFNSGTVDGCVASGYADNSSQPLAAVGGIIGNVQSGTSVVNCYSFVKIGVANENAASVLGKNATLSHLGTSNYWSSLVSGNSYAVPNDGVGQNEIYSSVSVLNVPVGAGGLNIARSSITHKGSNASVTVDLSKTAYTSDRYIKAVNTSTGFRITSNVVGTCGQFYYFANITLPSGVGISGKTISQRFSIPVIISESAQVGAGTTPANPIIITTYSQLKFIKNAPSAHYKLSADIVTDNTWEPFAFSGTLDGNGHTISIKNTLFTDVAGSRNADINAADWKTSIPNIVSGHIHDINIVAISAVNGPVFRNVRNATLENITYSAASGGYSQIDTAKSGALIGEISGNVYMYGCYVSAPVNISSISSEGIAALIGYVSADNFIIDNCGTSSTVKIANNISKVAGLIGFIVSVNGKGVISNNYASGGIFVKGNVSKVLPNIMLGALQSKANLTVTNNYYSVSLEEVSQYTVSRNPAPIFDGVNLFGFDEGAFVLKDGEASSIDLAMPKNLSAIESPVADDFTISFDSSDIQLNDNSVEISDNTLTFEVEADGIDNQDVIVSVIHEPTGLVASAAPRSALAAVNGYYEIYTPSDLMQMAEGFDPNANYKLCADIDMTGYTIPLMATSASDAFTGEFIGADKPDGGKYTISNLTIAGTSTTPVGLFCYANGAEFRNFALENVTVTNSGRGTGLLVGYADSSSATDCKFYDIDIINCTVTSTYKVSSTTASLTTMAEAGAIVGSVRSTSTGNVYAFERINVSNTTVENKNNGGSFAIGGLIGDSCAAGTVVIGTPEGVEFTEPSIVFDNLTLDGYGFVGGIIGLAGGLPQASLSSNISAAKGGIAINNVLVNGSEILARRGYVGGILGNEGCEIGKSKIINSTVSNSYITAEGKATGTSSSNFDAGGLSGRMAGLIENCIVDSCEIKACFAGGIVGRATRKASTHNGTLIEINNCSVIGKTVITDNGTGGTVNELGGIISAARTSSATITNCGIGEDVYIHGTALYIGGIMGASVATSTYYVIIDNCVSYATVELEYAKSTAAAGGMLGYSNMPLEFLEIKECVVAGEVNCNEGYCGGVIGYYNRTAKGTITTNATLIVDCTVTALLNANSKDHDGFINNVDSTAKLVGRTGGYSNTNWMGNTIATACNGNIVSSYPQDIRIFGLAVSTTSSTDIQSYDYYLGTFKDINKPDGNYLNGTADGVVIDGSVSAEVEVVISNENADYVGFDDSARLVFDIEDNTTLLKYKGWASVSNGVLVVTDATVGTADEDAVVYLKAKKNSTTAGFTGNYYIPGKTVPGTAGDKVLVPVMIPVICQNISSFNLSGTGTENDPYVIMSKDDLDAVRSGPASAYYVIGANIEFTDEDFAEGGFFYNSGEFFLPITFSNGGNSVPFTGSFASLNDNEGNPYRIVGLKTKSLNNAALFASAENATFANLCFDGFKVNSTSGSAAVVVAEAENVNFNNIQIYSSDVSGLLYAGTVAASVTGADADNIIIEDSTLSMSNYIGGVFGRALASEITDSELTNINITSNYSGDIIDIAAGIVGEFSGNISNVTVGGSGIINGSCASGAVGRIGFEAGDPAATVSNVTIDGKYAISSSRSSQKAAAAGIVAKINDKENQIVGVNVTINDCYISKDVDISAYYYAGGVVGASESWNGGKININGCETFADVTASLDNGVNGHAGAIIGLVESVSVLSVDNCVASGTVTAVEGAGGVIGILREYNSSAKISAAVISNTVVSADISIIGDAENPAKGIIIGNVDSTVIPTGLKVSPFKNIYYSSYQTGAMKITGNETVNGAGYAATVCDIQSNFQYTDGEIVSSSLPISGDGLVLGEENIIIGENGTLNAGAVSGHYKNFTVPSDVNFVLDDILSVDSLGQAKDLFTYDASKNILTIVSEGSGLALFKYKNGLEVTLNVTSFDIDGAGLANDPYIIKNVSHLVFINDYPNRYFVLGADIDFENDPNASTWPAAWFEREAAWADAGITFSGSLSGSYFERNEETGEYTDVPKTYAIKNLTIDSDTFANVGFFSILDGTVKDIIFENCTFTSTAPNSNVGAVAGVNNGTVSGVKSAGIEVSAVNAAGAVTGCSTGIIEDCEVSSGTVVSATHAAGGIAGIAKKVTDSKVTATTISAVDYAGGIAGSNVEDSTAASIFDGCEVSGTNITAEYISAGVLAYAESAPEDEYRSLTLENCIIKSDVTIESTGKNRSTGTLKYSYSAGIIGYLDEWYNGFVVRSNESYATVTANGDAFSSGSEYTVAGSVIGSTRGSSNFHPAENGEIKFIIVNNVAGGLVKSANYAGGIAGRLAFKTEYSRYRIDSGDFVCHNIISATFETLFTSSGNPGNNVNFALIASFIENTGLFNSYYESMISDNYYSSYVSKVGNPTITALGETSAVKECGLIDIAVDSYGSSSFKVKNNRYEYSEYETDDNGDLIIDENGLLVPTEDAVISGIVDIDDTNVFFETIAIGYHFSEYQDSNVYTKPVQFIFAGSDTDLGLAGSELQIYNSDSGVTRAISIVGLYVSPMSASSSYISEMSFHGDRIASSFTVISSDETEAALIADLGYGLKVGINISSNFDGSISNGSIGSPYLINDAEDFAYYFFGEFATTTENDYLRKYYKQTQNISFSDIVYAIAVLKPDTAISNTFAPIGNESEPFLGGYDGNEKIISGFTYSGTDDNTGLFGYVGGDESASFDYRLRDIHIELAEEGVSGGKNTGGLVGTYSSNCKITNCSVVYGSVTGTENVGGLVGKISDTTLIGCFTSTDVRAKDVGSSICSVGGIAGYLSLSTTSETLSFTGCFSSSDVVGFEMVSGFIGKIESDLTGRKFGKINLEDCSFTGSVTAMRQESSATESTNTSLVVGHFSTGATADARARVFVTAKNVVIAGTNTTEYISDIESKIYYPVLFSTAPLNENSTNVYYDAPVIGRITIPNKDEYLSPYQMWVTGDIYDIKGSTLQSGENLTNGIVNSNTKELTSMKSFGAEGKWDCSDSELYPVVVMRDKYSNAFAKLSAMPVKVDSREADDSDLDSSRNYKGLTYPLTVKNEIEGNSITVTSSAYTAKDDTVAYNTSYDRNLYGNGGTDRDTSDMKTDILFKNSDDGILLLRNSCLNGSTASPRDEKSPYVEISTEVDGVEVSRKIRIPLRTKSKTEGELVYISTERQLRAIMNSTKNGVEYSGKFYDAYNGATSKNIYICADIDLNGSVNFTPISGYGGNSLVFDGSNCIISNLFIENSSNNMNTGFFDVLNTGGLEIRNIILRNVNVNGAARTGALVGSVENNVLFNNCMVITDAAGDYKVSGTISVGGLIGWMGGGFIGYKSTESSADQYTKNQVSGAAVSVKGTNYVGGFVGYTKGATISNSFATGDVTRKYDSSLGASNYFDNGVSAFGGFVGYAEFDDVNNSGKIQYTFASGNVNADFSSIDTSYGSSTLYKMGIGGFAGIAKMDIQNCFSSGDVHSDVSNISAHKGVNYGIGGLVGYSEKNVNNAYSSSKVEFDINSTNLPILAGVGGVVGVSTSSVEYVYSSGSVFTSNLASDSVKFGGVVGNGNDVNHVYYDTWTNNIEELTAVGNITNTEFIRGFTTDEFCSGILVEEEYLSDEWGYDNSDNSNSYPYLKEFCKDYVSDYVRYPAILSVVAVRPNDRDEAVRAGRGYSMALTMPTSLTMEYIDTVSGQTTQRTYNLEWAAGSELGAEDGQFAGGLIKYGNNTFAPIRTSNTEQYLQLVAYVKNYVEDGDIYDNNGAEDGYKEYGTREISKLYQMMLGTEEYPYLISTSLDLSHIGFTIKNGVLTNTNGDYGSYPDFYDRWYSPINPGEINKNMAGKVYFKLISNVDMTQQITINEDGSIKVETVEGRISPTIEDMTGNIYPDGIEFAGIQIDGDDYAIVNFVSGGSFIENLDEESEIKNLIFDDVEISAEDDAAIIGTNNGNVDGLIVMSDKAISSANGNAAAIASVNNGSIVNSVTKVNVSGSAYVGGISAENNGTIEASVSDSKLTATENTIGIGGIAGRNDFDAEISKSVSVGTVTGTAASYAGGFVGVNEGTISDSYSRTETSGTFEKASSFAGANSGTISNAFSAGKTSIEGTDASSKGSAFVANNSGTLKNAYADKALLTSNAYMLTADAVTTEDIIAGVCFDTESFEYCADGVNAYPQIKALMQGDSEGGETSETYEMIKYKLLETYSALTSVTVDSSYGNYIDILAPVQNKVSAVPEGYTVTPSGTISSGSGTVKVTAPTVSQKIGAGANTQDDITYNLQFGFDYSVSADKQNPNFKDGIGSESDPYIIDTNNSFESLSYFGSANDAYFKMVADVSFDGNDLYAPIDKMAGTLDGNGFTVSDITINSNTALIGEITGKVQNLGITGIVVNANPTETETNFGLLAGKATGANISNVFAVGELKVSESNELSANVGGLVGYLNNSDVSGVVTSGYIRNDCTGKNSTVGGIAGLVDGGTLQSAESTAYVFGEVTVGGIAGKAVNAQINNVIFAGTVADTVLSTYNSDAATDTADIGQIVGDGTANNAYYDKQLALFTDTSATAKSTIQLVRADVDGFTKDASLKYYPNPINVTDTSDAFKAGLNFSLARINVSLAGGEGALDCYDQISVTSPVNKDADIVSLVEDRTRFADENSYMSATSSSLVPDGGREKGFTGIKATLNDSTGSSYDGNVNDIYRYVEVYIVRVIEIDYVIRTTDDTFSDDLNVGLMIRPEMDGDLKITSNAVTSIGEDADTNSGAYTVKFSKIIVTGDGFTVDTLLPAGYDFRTYLEATDEEDGYSGSISEENSNFIELGNTDKVKLYVEIFEADEVWGLQNVSGGLN